MFICVVKQVIGAVKGVGSKKDIQRSNHRGMKVNPCFFWFTVKTSSASVSACSV